MIAGSQRYEAEIRRTSYGVAHIRAEDWGSLGFGQGYACAGDHCGTIVDQIVKVRGERSLHLGRGAGDVYLLSDIGYRALDLHGQARASFADQPSHVAAMLEGYAAGVNAWLESHDREHLPNWCRDATWIGPIDAEDLFAYAADLARAASGRNMVSYIAQARPPGPEGMAPTPPLPVMAGAEMSSNGWAVGRAKSASGHGIVVANPHFPWHGEARFWENHLTIPGEIDVYGASLVGAPGIQIGFNRSVGWTHTFSIGKRFTFYQLTLEAGNPTRYHYGDELREMESFEVSVDVVNLQGSVERETRILWKSHYGPMLNPPLLGWSEQFAFSYRDANEDSTRLLAQWLSMDRAGSMDEFQAAFRQENGIPWATTVAVDADGRVWFIDASHTPRLTVEGSRLYRERLVTDPIAQLLDANRVAVLDGSDPACEWEEVESAPAPGLLSFDELPQLEREDWVFNSNESHWLTNPAAPLTGYPVLMGQEDFAPSPRTRANLVALGRPGSRPGGSFGVDELVGRLLSNRSVLADALCDEVVQRLGAAGRVKAGDRVWDLALMADLLASWDRCFDLDSRGAVLWREIMAGFTEAELCEPGRLLAEPFSLSRPFDTPSGLAPAAIDQDPLIDATVRALEALESAGVPVDSALGEVQWALRGTGRIPVHGGAETDGVANILMPIGMLPRTSTEPVPPHADHLPGRTERTGLRVGGYQVSYGTSFLMAVEITPSGPVARGLLAYGQSEDPASAHFDDQVELYAHKHLRPMLFEESEIASDPNLQSSVVQG